MSLASNFAELVTATVPRGDALAQTTEVSTTGVRAWIEDNIVFTILTLIACVVLMGGLRGNFSKVVTVGGLSLVGLAYLASSPTRTQRPASATGRSADRHPDRVSTMREHRPTSEGHRL